MHCRRAVPANEPPLLETDGVDFSVEEEVLLDENKRREEGGNDFYMVSGWRKRAERVRQSGDRRGSSDSSSSAGGCSSSMVALAEAVAMAVAAIMTADLGSWSARSYGDRRLLVSVVKPDRQHSVYVTNALASNAITPSQLDSVSVSPDQKLLAWSEDTKGGEKYTLHVKVRSGGGRAVHRVQWTQLS